MKLCHIGCGEHAESSHGPAQARCAAAHDDLQLAACCDVDPERASRHRARFGFARSYTDPLAMLDAERPDLAVLVVPDTITVSLGSDILERGIPLLLEKPPGRTLPEIDLLIGAAERGGNPERPVPHQVAFNRRYVPLVQETRRRLRVLGSAEVIQHIHYEMTRVERRDPDFSTTAIHGLDAVRFLAGSEVARASIRYQELPGEGPGVCNIFVDTVFASGATAHLAFCPVAGVVVERATIHAAFGHTFFLQVPMWGAFDSPGRLQHLDHGQVVADLGGDLTGEAAPSFVLGGFYGEYEAFLRDLREGRAPSPSLRESRPSVALAACLRARETEYQA
jgi:myo-inositol 2-dehydrogenase / D-chiro-inositol 1-dehydrogenase